MRGKRSKQYRKLLKQYALTFGFREPYQVVVDAQMVLDAHRFAMDLPSSLSRTLHGEVKPMITQCSIRHLYALPVEDSSSGASQSASQSASQPAKPTHPPSTASASTAKPSTTPSTSTPQYLAPSQTITTPTKTALLNISRSLTLRRCNHHTLPAPLSPLSCLSSVFDPNQSGTNKHHLVLAAQDTTVRKWARMNVRGVPSVYVKRSVMVMEPMAEQSLRVKEVKEREKIKGVMRKDAQKGDGERAGKRKRGMDEGDALRREASNGDGAEEAIHTEKPKRKVKGPRGPNPLSIKKAKGADEKLVERRGAKREVEGRADGDGEGNAGIDGERSGEDVERVKRKRKRKRGKSGDENAGEEQTQNGAESLMEA